MASALVTRIQKIPPKTRIIILVVLIVMLLVVYVSQFRIPMTTQIKELERSVAELQAKMKENDQKIKKLDDLKAEVKVLQSQLLVLTEQLPPESEVSGLLRQIQGLVNQSGLTLKLWKPERRKTHASGLYEEIPIALVLSGGYHNTAALFDRIGKLTRIVNILNIKMSGAKVAMSGAVEVDISCSAVTFAAVEKKVETVPTTGKKVQ